PADEEHADLRGPRGVLAEVAVLALEEAAVGLEADLLHAGGDVVYDLRLGDVKDAPAGRLHAAAPVDLVVIHEKLLVQQAHLLHRLAAGEQAGAGDFVHLGPRGEILAAPAEMTDVGAESQV